MIRETARGSPILSVNEREQLKLNDGARLDWPDVKTV